MTDVFKVKENHMSWNLYTFIQVDKKGLIYLKMFGTSCGVMLYICSISAMRSFIPVVWQGISAGRKQSKWTEKKKTYVICSFTSLLVYCFDSLCHA